MGEMSWGREFGEGVREIPESVEFYHKIKNKIAGAKSNNQKGHLSIVSHFYQNHKNLLGRLPRHPPRIFSS